MYKKMIKNKSFTKINYYKKYKNILTSLLRLSKKLYYSNKINNNKNNIKYTWSIINNLINPNLGKKDNNSNSPNANEFNTFFSNIGINLSEKYLHHLLIMIFIKLCKVIIKIHYFLHKFQFMTFLMRYEILKVNLVQMLLILVCLS